MTRTPTIRRTNLQEITPLRLHGAIDYRVFDQYVDFHHRGKRCSVDELISSLGAAIDHAAIEDGEQTAPSTLSETKTVDVVLAALQSTFPSWFGNEAALESLEAAVSEHHLSKNELREDYWGDEINPTRTAVQGDNWTDQKRVIIPLLALTLQHLRFQQRADRESAVDAGMTRIKKTVMREAFEQDLSENQVLQAVHNGLAGVEDA